MVKIIRGLGDLQQVGDVYSDNRFKAATMVVVPVAVTLTASYLINKSAYPKDFSLLKWLGIPVALGLISLVTMAGTFYLLGPLEAPDNYLEE